MIKMNKNLKKRSIEGDEFFNILKKHSYENGLKLDKISSKFKKYVLSYIVSAGLVFGGFLIAKKASEPIGLAVGLSAFGAVGYGFYNKIKYLKELNELQEK